MAVRVVDGDLIERTERVVEADAAPAAAPVPPTKRRRPDDAPTVGLLAAGIYGMLIFAGVESAFLFDRAAREGAASFPLLIAAALAYLGGSALIIAALARLGLSSARCGLLALLQPALGLLLLRWRPSDPSAVNVAFLLDVGFLFAVMTTVAARRRRWLAWGAGAAIGLMGAGFLAAALAWLDGANSGLAVLVGIGLAAAVYRGGRAAGHALGSIGTGGHHGE